MTRSEQEMYKNIERIAVALETLVIQGKDVKINQFKKATNILYGNDQHTGRTADNYEYPSKGTSNTHSDLDTRIYAESQSCTGEQFDTWHSKLTDVERESYRRVYGH